MQVDINPKDIEQAIVNAVIESSLGDSIREMVQDAVDGISKKHHKSILKTSLEAEIQRIVVQLLRDEYATQLRDAVREHLTEQMVNTTIVAAIDAFHDKLI